MRLKTRTLIVLGWIMVGIAAGGPASAYVFDMGPGSMIDTSATNSVLRLDIVNMNPGLDNLTFDLTVGQSQTFYFATIGTTETWINSDDINPGPVQAYVDFDNPDLVQTIGGTSLGFSALWQFLQGWNLTWDAVQVNPGSGLDFTVELSDVGFRNWFWQGPDGTADIYATVTLNAVPLPAPLLLFGSGLIGLIAMRKKWAH